MKIRFTNQTDPSVSATDSILYWCHYASLSVLGPQGFTRVVRDEWFQPVQPLQTVGQPMKDILFNVSAWWFCFLMLRLLFEWHLIKSCLQSGLFINKLGCIVVKLAAVLRNVWSAQVQWIWITYYEIKKKSSIPWKG